MMIDDETSQCYSPMRRNDTMRLRSLSPPSGIEPDQAAAGISEDWGQGSMHAPAVIHWYDVSEGDIVMIKVPRGDSTSPERSTRLQLSASQNALRDSTLYKSSRNEHNRSRLGLARYVDGSVVSHILTHEQVVSVQVVQVESRIKITYNQATDKIKPAVQ